jgi:hypothetical protein
VAGVCSKGKKKNENSGQMGTFKMNGNLEVHWMDAVNIFLELYCFLVEVLIVILKWTILTDG